MEKVNAFDKKTLLAELTRGRKMANQLKNELDQETIPESTCEALIEKILSTYDKALAVLSWRAIKEEASTTTTTSPETGMLLGSPQPHSPVAASTSSEVSNGVSKDEKPRKHVFKKR